MALQNIYRFINIDEHSNAADSTDFKKMGELTAQMILNNEKNHIEVPFSITLRKSL